MNHATEAGSHEPKEAPAEAFCQAWGGQGPEIHPVRWVEWEEDVWLREGKILGFIPVLTGQKAAVGKRELT